MESKIWWDEPPEYDGRWIWHDGQFHFQRNTLRCQRYHAGHSAQALQAAQQYLDTALPGTKTASDADPFYGYYTIDILRDGNIIGMLSVNGYNSQVFLHTWHGTFIATQDY